MLLTAEVSMVIVGALCLRPPGLGDGGVPLRSGMLREDRLLDLKTLSPWFVSTQPKAQSLGMYLVAEAGPSLVGI
jgi:hypothetical protein